MAVVSRVLIVVFRLSVLILVFLLIPHLHATTFKSPPLIPTAMDPLELVTADVNKDGKLDLVYLDGNANSQTAVHILLGNGNGTYTHTQDVPLPTGICCDLTIADVTGDGKPDLLIAGNTSTAVIVAVLAGNGDGTFQAPILSSFVPSNFSGFTRLVPTIAVGDINDDGKVDLAILDIQNARVYLLLGNNTASFTYEGSLQTNADSNIYLLDLNGDGYPDLITTNSIGASFEVFLGKGNGTFSNFSLYSSPTPAGPFLLTDVDRDGHPDILTVYYPNQIGYFKGNPDGTFSSLVSLGPSPSQNNPLVSAADVNSDGILDLTFLTPSGIAVSLGGSGLSFGTALTTISGGSMSPYSDLPRTPVTGDFNGDGHTDVAMAVEGGIVLLFGNGDGTFRSDQFYDMGETVGGAAVAKFSGTGNMDIAVTLPATFPRLLLGDGEGNFTLGPDPNPSYGMIIEYPVIYAADFNGDGKPDVNLGDLLPNQSSAPSAPPQTVAFNQGNGVFSTPVTVANGSPIMADFNGDGRMDMISVSGVDIVVSLGQSNNSFTPVTTSLRLPFDTGFFNVGDLNNDGKPDLVLDYRDHMEIWFGNGDGTFSYSSSINVETIVNAAVGAVADVDGDGNVDILLSPEADVEASLGPVAIFYGNGDGTFQAPVFLPTTRRFYNVLLADVNQDKLPDLIMTDGACVAVFLNLGNRNFASEVDYVAGRSISGLNVVDVNSDGYPDIVVANGDGYVDVEGPNFSGTTVTVLLNEPESNPPTGAPVTGNLSIAPNPAISGQPVAITLNLKGQTIGAAIPTGSVSFSVDGSLAGDAPLLNGAASYTYTDTLTAIQHTITATYNGDSTYAPMSFASVIVVQPPTYPTTTSFIASPSTLLAGNTVRLTATVTSTVSVPAGEVTFLDGGATIGSVLTNSASVAYFDTNLLAAGAHELSARFQGATKTAFNYETSYTTAIFSPSTSVSLPVTVTTETSTVSLTASSNAAIAGTVLTFTAQVSSLSGVPFGSASFYDGNVLLSTLSLNARGQASYSTASLSAGGHSITAEFNTNGPYGGSSSAPLGVSINSAPSDAIATLISLKLQLNASNNPSLQAVVSADSTPSGGTITFLDGGTIVGMAPLGTSGVAVLQLSTFGTGKHTLTASYAGTPGFAPTVSPVLNEQWPSTGPGFSLQIVPAENALAAVGLSFQVTASSFGDFSQPVQLSCVDGLPQGYSCKFSSVVLSRGSGTSPLTIVPVFKSSSVHPGPVYCLAIVLGFAGVFCLGEVRRLYPRIILLAFGCFIVGSFNGCASAARPTQVSVVTVQASAGSGSQTIIHSVQFSVRLPSSL